MDYIVYRSHSKSVILRFELCEKEMLNRRTSSSLCAKLHLLIAVVN